MTPFGNSTGETEKPTANAFNCGIGKGGFQKGNKCAGKGGRPRKEKVIDESESTGSVKEVFKTLAKSEVASATAAFARNREKAKERAKEKIQRKVEKAERAQRAAVKAKKEAQRARQDVLDSAAVIGAASVLGIGAAIGKKYAEKQAKKAVDYGVDRAKKAWVVHKLKRDAKGPFTGPPKYPSKFQIPKSLNPKNYNAFGDLDAKLKGFKTVVGAVHAAVRSKDNTLEVEVTGSRNTRQVPRRSSNPYLKAASMLYKRTKRKK